MNLEELTNKIKGKFPESILTATDFRDENTLVLRAGDILPVCRFLHDDPELAFDFLIDLCGVDHYPRDPRFEVIYHLCATKSRSRLRLKTPLSGTTPHAPSVVSVWKAAGWMEREAFDLLGIIFDGHPDLRRILLTPDWEGHPLRKDYPLRG